MSFGGAGAAFILILSLTAAVIVGSYVLAYLAHCLVTIVESTAAGNDTVAWPDEPISDWIARAFWLGGLLMVWLAPAAILSSGLRNTWLEYDSGMRFLILAVPGLWLFFPIGVLSSMSGSSRWMVFRLAIVRVLLHILPSTLIFYFLTAVVALPVAAAWYYAVFHTNGLPLVFIAGPVGAVGFLLYARLLGRLSLMIHRRNPPKEERDEKRRKKKKRRRPENREGEAPAEPEMEGRQEPRPPEPTPFNDPDLDLPAPLEAEDAAAPSEVEDDEFPLKPLERDEEHERRRPTHWSAEDEEGAEGSYDMDRAAPAAAPEYRPIEDFDLEEMGPQFSEEDIAKVDTPMDRKRRRWKPPPPAPPGPRHPWLQGIWTFPFYGTTIGASVWLTIGLVVFGFCCALFNANLPRGE